jgi:hypothetical protein
MSAAGHPGIQVLREEYWATRGILRRTRERAVREVAGWEIVREKLLSVEWQLPVRVLPPLPG